MLQPIDIVHSEGDDEDHHEKLLPSPSIGDRTATSSIAESPFTAPSSTHLINDEDTDSPPLSASHHPHHYQRQSLVEPHNPVTARLYSIIGVLCLLVSIIIWIADAEILQGLEARRPMARAIVMTYWIRCAYTSMAIPLGIWALCRKLFCASPPAGEPREAESYFIKFTPSWPFIKFAFGLNSFVFLCEVFWYNSLAETSVSVNTAIYNSLPVFVLILSALLLGEAITWRKSISVFIGILGLVVESIFNSGQGKSTGIGIVLVLISTFLFAIYSVMSKKWNDVFFLDTSHGKKVDALNPKQSSLVQIATCLKVVSVMGAVHIVTIWPLMFVAQWLHLDSLSMSWWDLGIYILLGLSGAIYSLFALMAILLTNPLFVSVGTLMTIPVSILSDMWIHHILPPAISYLGIALICISFIALSTGGVHSGH